MDVPDPEQPVARKPRHTVQDGGLQTVPLTGPPGLTITARPANHTLVCWAAAQGSAERLIGGYIDHHDPDMTAQIVAVAVDVLAADASQCICPKPKVRPASSQRGRRYR